MSKTFQPDSLHPYIMDARLKKATGSGGISNIPIASADTIGGIMIGGSANPITITGSGNASVRKATSELLGVVKAGNGISINEDGTISAGDILSTTEHKTGEKDIDGKDIYSKSFTVNALPNTTEMSFNHSITNIYRMTSLIGSAQNVDKTTFFPLPYVAQENFAGCIKLSMNATKISIWAGSDRSGLSAVVTVKYTKTTP